MADYSGQYYQFGSGIGNANPGAFQSYNYTPIQQPQQNRINVLLGKGVNSENDISPSDVPMNGDLAFFPNVNGKEIYVKKWTSDGRIETQIYKLENAENQKNPENYADRISKIESDISYIKRRLNNNNKNNKENNNVES